jgi:RHS repeat-associated protein
MSTALRTYFRGHNLATVRDDAAQQSRVYHYDHQGTTQCLTESAGAVTDRFASDAWGVPVKRTGNASNPLWYGAAFGYQLRTSGALLYYARSRHLSWSRGAWLSVDRLPKETRWEGYVYARNSPCRWIDPSGLDGCDPADCCDPAAVQHYYHDVIGSLCKFGLSGVGAWSSCDEQWKLAESCRPSVADCQSAQQTLINLSNSCVGNCTPAPGGAGAPPEPWAAVMCCADEGSKQPKHCATKCCKNNDPTQGKPSTLRACLWKCVKVHESVHEKDCDKPLDAPATQSGRVRLDECCAYRAQVSCILALYGDLCGIMPAPDGAYARCMQVSSKCAAVEPQKPNTAVARAGAKRRPI